MLTDFLDNPVKRGDVVIYPTASGSSSASVNVAIVDHIDPIIRQRVPNYSGRLVERTTLESYVMAGKKNPTEYPITRKRVKTPSTDATHGWIYEWVEDQSKAYVARVFKLDASWDGYPSAKSTILKNVDRLIVVPREQWGPAFRTQVLDALEFLRQNGIAF